MIWRPTAFKPGGNATEENTPPSTLRMEAELNCETRYQLQHGVILGDSSRDTRNYLHDKSKSCNII